ncbi:hypothetical protein PINS_up009339 [Pythium insidiosum]|nr:hypothetical protein PINS_up009339 [Pythium insidiosum]
MVQAREWRGSNKPGGVARIVQVHEAIGSSSDGVVGEPTHVVTYDVAYVLSNAKEKHVDARFVRAYVVADADDSSESARSQKRRR